MLAPGKGKPSGGCRNWCQRDDGHIGPLAGHPLLAFAIACSANFPALLLSIVWRRFTTAGAVASILTGSILTVVLIVISPTVWVDILGNPTAIFGLRNPAIVSMTVSFIVGAVVSLMKREASAEAAFEDEKLRTYLGIGAE